MNSRQRVRAVINGKIPDRIPNGLGGCETAGLHVLSYDKLQSILKIPKIPPRINTFMTNAVFEIEAIKKMEGDIILLASPRMCKADLWSENYENQWKKQVLWGKELRIPSSEVFINKPDGGVIWETAGNIECPSGSYFFDSSMATDFLADFDFPSPDDYNPSHELPYEMLRNLEETAKKVYNETELSICLGETITSLQYKPGGMIGSMIFIKEKPDQMREFMQKAVDSGLAQLKLLDQAVGKYVDILSIAQDMGDNRGITIGQNTWRDIYKPFYKQLFQGWRKITDMKINLHSCGAIHEILGDLIECGMHIYNPVQISGNGMDAKGLKEKFGNDLVFWGGGYDAQQNSINDSYETVYKRISETIRIFGNKGGYIFSGVHNLPPDVPETHLKAMLDAWHFAR